MSKESLKKTFLELVAINSYHPDEQEMIDFVGQWFDRADIPWKQDSFGNVFAYIPGHGEPVLLSTHLDIPEPAPNVNPIIEGDIIRSDGTSILGADPKTGLAIILELAKTMSGAVFAKSYMNDTSDTSQKQKRFLTPFSPVEIILTRGEEKGLLGALNADYSLISAKIGFVLDDDGPVTRVTVKAPGYVRFDASFVGREAHPRAPEKGINALQVFCHAAADVPWGYVCDGVTWNIGQLTAGTARNSVPRNVSLSAELRSFDTEKLRNAAMRVEKQFCAAAQKFGAKCDIANELLFEGYEHDTGHSLFSRMDFAYKKLRLTPLYHETNGCSDVNVFISHGITAVTLGSGYYNAHEYSEYASIADMVEISEFIKEFLSCHAVLTNIA